MKKQNNQNKLAFGKATVTELNNYQLINIQGGSTGAICDAVKDVIDDLVDVISKATKPQI